jgi:hypothetical protein
MVSFWDKVERRQRLAADEGVELRDLQIELWGWRDERPRDGVRNWRNGFAGNRLPPPPRQNGFNIVGGNNLGADTVIVDATDDLLVAELPVADLSATDMSETDLSAVVTSTPDDGRYEVQTLAELFEYVSAAWDPGGSSYCATRTWFGCGLDDVFQGLASKEGLSATERSALSARMRDAMPLCRNCRCKKTNKATSYAGDRDGRGRARRPKQWAGRHREGRGAGRQSANGARQARRRAGSR